MRDNTNSKNLVFSVLIINYHSASHIRNLLVKWEEDNLTLKTSGDWEILILENGSPNQKLELEILQKSINQCKNPEKVKLFISRENLGFGGGNNYLAKKATGKWLFLLNADTLTDVSILDQFAVEIKKIKNKSGNEPLALAPSLLLTDGVSRQRFAYGRFPSFWGTVFHRDKFEQNLKSEQDGHSLKVDWISGAAILVEKKSFLEIQGFDENFFMYFEDIDLCLRLKKADPKRYIFVLFEAKLIHLGGGSLEQNKKRFSYYFNSQNYYWEKHFSKTEQLCLKALRWPYKWWKLHR